MESIRIFKSKISVFNGQTTVNGLATGKMHMPTGEITVRHDYDAPLVNFNSGFIPVGALTGIPEPERPIGIVVNPFRGSKSFEFKREVKFLEFPDTLSIEGAYKDGASTDREGYLNFSGTTPSPKMVQSILPTAETWIRGKAFGEIYGSFDMVFVMSDGQEIIGRTETHYRITESPSWSDFVIPHFRFITIQAESSTTHLFQTEQISLFSQLPGHINKITSLPIEEFAIQN